ncbi:trehalose-phosphatase [Phyllobacterium sp. UNC302MFCol5.2]|uniref:trehalose-phosphatase n=1 Tax=Phyllobacterium sp. UNC302MFCol5.2 TaxID=1449065 RepID=UPI0006913F80|nr:trehalose-phosphatase [Phyllobacterium sp. UNC302MFCol5.2]
MYDVSEVLPAKIGSWALFLDVDGTLIDIAATPDSVEVPPSLPHEISQLAARLGGALALVSGRSIASIDALFTPCRFAAAGLHGAELRSTLDGSVERTPVNDADLDDARRELDDLVRTWPGIIIEDKGISLAVHYRQAEAAHGEVDQRVSDLLTELGPNWVRQDGKMVVEIRPSGTSKGEALIRLMAHPPFQGRLPIAIGDDITDEAMFGYVNEVGGRSVKVGTGDSKAQFTVDTPDSVRKWIAKVSASV